MKNVKNLTASFLLAGAVLAGSAYAETYTNRPADTKPAAPETFTSREVNVMFDTDKISYDVDVRANKCFAVTFYGPGWHDLIAMGMSNVACDKDVLELVPAEKKAAYIKKYGAPKQ